MSSFLKSLKNKMSATSFCFYLIIMILMFFLVSLYKTYNTSFEIKNIFSPVEPITINLDFNARISTDFFVCYDDNCIEPDSDFISSVYYSIFTKDINNTSSRKIKNILIAYPSNWSDFEDRINSIDIHIGNKNSFLEKKDVKKLKHKDFKIEVTNHQTNKVETKTYKTILLDSKGNSRGSLATFSTYFLAPFYSVQDYIFLPKEIQATHLFLLLPVIFWLWVLGVIGIYILNKDKINLDMPINFIKNKPLYILFGIILLGIILRLTNLTYYPLWTDEVYTKTVAIKSFISCFKDSGNPPLFFLLEYIISKIIGNSDLSLRILPLISSICFIPLIYLLFKNINKNLGLLFAFLGAINTINIYHSTEARGYSLCMTMVVLGIYLLFKYLDNPNKKNLIYYTIYSCLTVNLNYYLVFFIFSNYIWGMVDLFQNKKKNNNDKNFLYFSLSNLIAVLAFVPYLLINFKTALNGTFNTWIPVFSKETVLYTINEYFINKYVFLAFVLIISFNVILTFIPKNLLEKINIKIDLKKENLLIYLVYTVCLILLIISFVSVEIKPIFHKRTLLSIYSILFMIECVGIMGVFDFVKQNKYLDFIKVSYSFVLIFIMFLITKPMPIRQIYRTDDFMKLIENDGIKFEKEYEIHAFDTDFKDYLNNYPNVKKMNIKWHYLNGNGNKHLEKLNKFDYIDKNKKSVIYIHAFAGDIEKLLMQNLTADVFKTNSISTMRIIYNPKGEQ